MCCESESLSSAEVQDSKETGGEIRKESRVSYTRESLLSLAELDPCKELPDGFDQSILSELNDTYNNTLEHQNSWGTESLGGSAKEERETWGWCKSSSKDKISKDSGRQNGNQTQHPRKNCESVASWRSSLQEQNGILGKWCDSKLSEGGSDVSTLKSQGPERSLLSKCNEPYRPPGFYQATSHLGRQNHDFYNNETFGSAEAPNKERAKDETWRKDSFDLMRNGQLKAIQQKQKSSPDDQKQNSDESSCSIFGTDEKYLRKQSSSNHSLVQVEQLPSKGQLLRQDPEIVSNVERLQGQILEGGRFLALANLEEAENVDPGFVDKAKFAASDSLRDGQSITVTNADFEVLKKNVSKTHVGSFSKRKETKANNIVPINSIEKTDINSSEVEVSVNPGSYVRSSQRASNSSEAFPAQEPKGVNINTPLSSGSPHPIEKAKLVDESITDICQSTHCIELYDTIVEGRDGCRSHSKFIPWFSNKTRYHVQEDKASSHILPRVDQTKKKAGESSTGMSMNRNLIDQGLSKEPSLRGGKAPPSVATKTDVSDCNKSLAFIGSSSFPYMFSNNFHHAPEPQLDKVDADKCISAFGPVSQTTEGSNLNPACNLHEGADSEIDIHLPDEDSLITIDDTCIFEQAPSSSISSRGAGNLSFAGSNHLLASESLHQNLSWHTRLLGSQMNSWQPFINLSNPRACPRAVHDPLMAYQDAYNLAAACHHFVQLPVQPRGYEPSVQHFVPPGVQLAENFSPYYNNFVSPQPTTHHQIRQIPYFQQEPIPSGNVPVYYLSNVDLAMQAGMVSRLGSGQMNLKAGDGSGQWACGLPINNQFW